MLQRMGVDGNNSDGSSPLMVLFVVMLVEGGMVEQPEGQKTMKVQIKIRK